MVEQSSLTNDQKFFIILSILNAAFLYNSAPFFGFFLSLFLLIFLWKLTNLYLRLIFFVGNISSLSLSIYYSINFIYMLSKGIFPGIINR